ncbi:lipopolysaccharide biosynthesis protein [Collinsella ihumii]|uniref:Oligosaccharide flippase family protein n=1 Tax=Collinsella ihumii TaxID=1720204 RepID=A0ABT7XD11_9ACTN|nr:oligosaccharide flippase family protein [Collinsella ihumii]MDN0063292.1 oligosaccharide flippase family protein [Collinsella ihumii]
MNKKLNIKKLSIEVRASLVFLFASVCSQGMSIISMPVFTRLLSTEQMGTITTYNTWFNFIGMITTLGLTSGSFNIAMMRFGDKRAQYTSSALTLSFIPSVPLFVLSFPFGNFFSSILGLSVPLVRCMCFMLVLNPALNLWLMKERYEYKYIAVFFVTVFNAVVGTLLAVVSVIIANGYRISDLPEIRLYSSSFITAVLASVIVVIIYLSGKTLFNAQYWSFAIKNGLPLIVHSVAKYILDASDKILIGYFIGSAAVGVYGVLYSLSSISLVFWSAINSALIPYIFEKLKLGMWHKIRAVASPLIIAYAVLCLFLMLLAPEITNVMAGSAYTEAVYLIPPISSGIFFTSLYNLYSNLLLYKEKTIYVMLATISAAVFNIIANIILLPLFGYIAAAYSTLASCCLLALMQYLFTTKLGISKVLDNRLNLGLSVTLIVSSIIINITYKNIPIIRYSIILILIIGVFINKKRIIGAFQIAKSKEVG